MKYPFIIYLKNKSSQKFELKSDVVDVDCIGNGYCVTFNNGRTYHYAADNVQYYPHLSTRENVRIYEKNILNCRYNTVDDYGRYLIYRDVNVYSGPIENSSDIEICDIKKNTNQAKSVISYFKEILEKSGEVSFDIQSDEIDSKDANQISSGILLRALGNIDLSDSRSVLFSYLEGVNPSKYLLKEVLIYPFGCNESQKKGVETALGNSLSIVEGPPGTGKTQTILNVIANLIVQNKTVAIVSNNNSAVFNVREKLIKYGYEMFVASLGNNENKTSFFDNKKKQTVDEKFKISKEELIEARSEVRDLDVILTKCFRYRNKLATLKSELSDAEIEFAHIRSEKPLNQNIKSELDNKFYRNRNLDKILKLKNLLSNVEVKGKLSIMNILRFFLQYGFWGLKFFRKYNEELYVYVNYKFYELYIDEIKEEIYDIEKWLEFNHEESNLKRFIETSKKIFNGVLYDKYDCLEEASFNIEDYRKRFNDFVKHYPVILSSTLSLRTSIPKDYLFDYLIIDESSQVDIIKASVCFSCCRNAVIVGDSMQLTHIVDKECKEVTEQLQNEYHTIPAYNYVEQNILNSLKSLYEDKIKSVLLKEHYRCHPAIIGFCNKKYYNNKLVVMTCGDNHPFRIIETSISGGRDNHNQRQIDETDLYIRENYSNDYTNIGVIAPYRNHVNMLRQKLPQGVEADTIHKFQGREKDAIIFNTVRNQIEPFIDNPNLINVAVSRAVKEFIIVKPESMLLPHGTNIGDMIRYICYTTDPKNTIVKGGICSVFDLLYKEYNKVFTSFLLSNKDIEGSPAEILVYKLLREKILSSDSRFLFIDIAREYKLRDLVRDYQLLSEEEVRFIKNNSRLDFLLYNKIDKAPILAIEVDGVSYHNNELQRERDKKKDHIMEVIGLPILRLSTDGYNEEAKIIENIKNAIGYSCVSTS